MFSSSLNWKEQCIGVSGHHPQDTSKFSQNRRRLVYLLSQQTSFSQTVFPNTGITQVLNRCHIENNSVIEENMWDAGFNKGKHIALNLLRNINKIMCIMNLWKGQTVCNGF